MPDDATIRFRAAVLHEAGRPLAIEQVEARARTFLGRLPAIGDWQRALVVTHWGFIRGLTGLRVTNGTAVRIDDAGRGEVVHAPEAC